MYGNGIHHTNAHAHLSTMEATPPRVENEITNSLMSEIDDIVYDENGPATPSEIDDIDDDEDGPASPPEVCEVSELKEKTLPPKSKEVYAASYNRFMVWKKKNNKSLSERSILAYFHELQKLWKPTTLWSEYSKLRSTLSIKNNVDISTFRNLKTFLSNNCKGYKSIKTKVLAAEHIEKFVMEAPDYRFLATKVAMIIGISGTCRRSELRDISIDHISDYTNEKGDHILYIKIPRTGTDAERSFTIEGEYYNVVKRYMEMRPQNTFTRRFFLNYQNGKCTHQVIGVNKFGGMPKQIAQYLKLPDPEGYTGRSFRRASLPTDCGTDIATLDHSAPRPDLASRSHLRNRPRKIPERFADPGILDPCSSNDNSMFEVSSPKRLKNDCDESFGASTSKEVDAGTNEENGPTSTTIVTPNKNITIRFENCSNVSFNFIVKQNDGV